MNWKCKLFGHIEGNYETSIEKGEMMKPNGEESIVEIRMVFKKCKRCDQTLEMHPAGIVSEEINESNS